MPVYEFVCLGCEERFERLLPMSAAEPASPACPACGEARARRQLSLIAGLSGARDGGSAAATSGCACGGACACRR